MTDKIRYFLEAWEMNGVGSTIAKVQDSPGTVVTITVDDLKAALESRVLAERKPSLAVWYGPMPESNGKTNWTAILHNGDISEGVTLDRSEYPDRVRYEADRVRYLIGELDKKPWICDYDADKHSGYKSAHPTPDDAKRLDKPAQVGNGRFGVGIKWSTVIAAAQRHHDFMNTPEKEAERIANAKDLFDELMRDAAIDRAMQDKEKSNGNG